MLTWWGTLTLLQKVLALVAIPSSLVLVLQTILMLVGLGSHGDVDAGHDAMDGDVGHDLPDHAAAGHAMDHLHSAEAADTAAFQVFSLRSVLAFFVLFGWVGLAMTGEGAPAWLSILVAFLAGTAGLLLTAWLFYLMQKLQASGNVHLSNAVGQVGEVYIPIPGAFAGSGKVNVMVQGRWMECDAQTAGEALKTGHSVRVVDVRGGTTLIVEPV